MAGPIPQDLLVYGIPETVPERVAAVCRSRLLRAAAELAPELDALDFALTVGTKGALTRLLETSERRESPPKDSKAADEPLERYEPRAPLYTFNQLVLPKVVLDELLSAIDILRVERTVFEEWGLRKIEPFPRTALNFHGPPGTGKTLAAHALAHRMDRKILVASYAEIESKYHGDGPKNVKALFRSAEQDGCVLFIDEADSLLSKRLTNITQGSEQAINSMRSQLLICLELFRGVVIFSTNLVQNYDKAFETRVRHVHFPLPDAPARAEIWRKHLVSELPVADDVRPHLLGDLLDDVCGRDIKNAVIDAAVRAAVSGMNCVRHDDLVAAINRIKAARVKADQSMRPLTVEEKADAEAKLGAALRPRTGDGVQEQPVSSLPSPTET